MAELKGIKKGDKVLLRMFTGAFVETKVVEMADAKKIGFTTKSGVKMVFDKKTGKQVSPEPKAEKFANYIDPYDKGVEAEELKKKEAAAEARAKKAKEKAAEKAKAAKAAEKAAKEEKATAKKSSKKKAPEPVEDEDDEYEEVDDADEYEEAEEDDDDDDEEDED